MEMFFQSTSDYSGLLGMYMSVLAATSGTILVSAYLLIILYTVADFYASTSKLARNFKRHIGANRSGKMQKPAVLRHALAGGKH